MTLTFRNPHSVLATLKTRPKDVLEIHLPGDKGGAHEAWGQVLALAQANHVKVTKGGGPRNPKSGSNKEGRVGAEATVRERTGQSLEELFSGAIDRKAGRGLWLALDCLQDPHNVGAIFRTASFFGVQGIIVTEERSAPLTGTAYDVASGGLEYVPFVMQTNLQRAFELAKDSGLWVLGTSEHAHDPIQSVTRDRPWLLVLGNEESGMRRLTEERCDALCKIPPLGNTLSLNVSVAAGIAISTLSQSD